jgi:hypothetical protein
MRKKTSLILIFLIIAGFSRQGNRNPLYKADFNQLVKYYGKNILDFTLPAKKTLDSLQGIPYVWVDGYRIQVAAISDRNHAEEIAEKLKQAVPDSVYVEYEKGLYRIQFGDYQDRIVAETKVDSMRKWGWPESWIVTRKVKKFLLKKVTSPDTVKVQRETKPHFRPSQLQYAIQIGAFSSGQSAKRFIREHLSAFSNVMILQRGTLYKVLIGPYRSEKEARIQLHAIQQAGFNDAWLTETEIR